MFRRSDRRSKADDESIDETPTADGEPESVDAVEDGADVTEDQPEDMDADLESQAADYLADNDAWLYGPYAKDVLEVIDRLEEVGPDDAEAIAEAWRSAPKADREAARKAVRKLTERDLEMGRHVQMAR